MARLIAIDLGHYSIKVTSFLTVGRGFELEDRFEQRVPQDGSAVTSAQQLAALDALLDEHPEWATVSTEKGLSWPATQATFRRVELPFTDPVKVGQTLPFAVEGEVPFDMDDMVLGSRVLSAEGSTDVLTVLTRHDTLERWIEDLAERGMDPRLVVVDGDLQGYYAATEGVSVVIDVGHTHTLVTLVQDGDVQMVRPLNVGGANFTRAIQTSLNVSWEEAEAIKHGERSADDEATDPGLGRGSAYQRLPAAAREAVDGQIGLLLAEVRAVLIGLEDQLGVDIDQVKLTGGGARWQELWDYLAQDLGLPVSRSVDHEGDPVPGHFAVSHALAMRLVKQTRGDEIDLRIDDLVFQGGVDMTRAVFGYGMAVFGFFAVAAVVVFAIQYRSLATERADLQERLVKVAKTVDPLVSEDELANKPEKAMAQVFRTTSDAEERAEVMRNLKGGVPPTVDLIAELTSAFPPHPDIVVNVTDLKITSSSISFTAETNGYTSSAAVEEALHKTERFKLAEKGDDTKKSGKVVFPVTIPFEASDDVGEEG